ncbi:MAG: hypothetical protein NC548_36530 [Lachnospiraceae bacterium]|nr:hypothetical protein [Lachnospiraceae bacterium]
MNYDVGRIARIYNHVFSTPRNSPERTARLEALSEADQEALFDYSNGILSGRIKQNKVEVEEMSKERNYEWYKKMMERTDGESMREVSQFAFDCPALYAQCRERYQAERAEAQRKHNYKLMGY